MNPRGVSPIGGIICLWSGAVVDIPDGWYLCDGNNGTPDLRNKFVVGAGSGYLPFDFGGSVTHDHDLEVNGPVGDGGGYSDVTAIENGLPPYLALAFIMKS